MSNGGSFIFIIGRFWFHELATVAKDKVQKWIPFDFFIDFLRGNFLESLRDGPIGLKMTPQKQKI